MTDNMQFIKEYLSTGTGTEGSLLIVKQIYDTMIEETEKALIPMNQIAIYIPPAGVQGSSIDIDLETANSMTVRLIPEAAEITLDQPTYSSINLKPDKWGAAIRITREMLEDGKWNLLERAVKIAGKRMAEQVNTRIIADALDQAGNTVSGGANVSIANLTRAMQHLEDNDYKPTTLFVGMEVANDIRNIDTFTEVDKSGSREMLSSGFIGTIYGMDVIKVSTNAGMTTTSSYVTDKEQAIILVVKRNLTVENFELPTYDMSGATITMRFKARHLNANAIAKITST